MSDPDNASTILTEHVLFAISLFDDEVKFYSIFHVVKLSFFYAPFSTKYPFKVSEQ